MPPKRSMARYSSLLHVAQHLGLLGQRKRAWRTIGHRERKKQVGEAQSRLVSESHLPEGRAPRPKDNGQQRLFALLVVLKTFTFVKIRATRSATRTDEAFCRSESPLFATVRYEYGTGSSPRIVRFLIISRGRRAGGNLYVSMTYE